MRKPKAWEQGCPNPACSHYKLMKRGNVKSIATYQTQSGRRRVFACKLCGEQFAETRETVFFDLRTAEERVIIVLKLLLCKVELSSISLAMGVSEETILAWLRRAAEKAEEINQHLLREVKVTRIELDELWSFVRRKKAQGAEADGFSSYLPALVEVYYQLKTFPHTGRPGRPKQPVKQPHPSLVYAQLVKHKQKGRLKSLTTHICCGASRLVELGLKISTSLVERFNLTLRHALTPLTRKSLGFCKDRTQLRRRVVFYQAFYNFARPHQSLRQPLSTAEPVQTTLFQSKWRQRTPAMAAGLTDHVWSFRELLTAKFEPCLNQSISR